MTSEEVEQDNEDFDITEVGSRKAIQSFLDTLPPPPGEDTIPA